MALSNTGISSGSSPIAATHVSQFFDLLTGAMTDQAVTIKNALTVGGGSEGIGTPKVTLVGLGGQTAAMIRALLLSGDANPTWQIDKNGKQSWGPGGGSAVDTTLERSIATFLLSNGGYDFTQVATPAAPGASKGRVYFKADNLPYFRAGAAGAETAIGVGGSATDPLLSQVWN